MRPRRRSAACAALALAATLWAATSGADTTTDQKAAAQVLFEAGRALVEHGQVSEACPKFAESQRLDPGIGTQLWLADCYESNGQTASAWVAFKEAAAAAALQHDRREKVGQQRAAALEPKLSRMMIVVSDRAMVAGLEVRRDGVTVGPTEWGMGVPLDPGVHSIAASAPGRQPWSTTVQIPVRAETLQVTIPTLEAATEPVPTAAPAPVAAPLGAAPPPVLPAETTQPAGGSQRAVGLTLGVAGAVALGVGTFFSFDAKSTYDASNQAGHCSNDVCDTVGQHDRAEARTKAAVATLAMGVGGAGLVAGGLLYWLAPRSRTVGVAVNPSPRGGDLAVSVRW